jgi:hypothetical protein
VDNSGITQPVAGTVTANSGSGTFFLRDLRDGTGDTTQANVFSGRLHVDGSGVTLPVSGTVTRTCTGAFTVDQADTAALDTTPEAARSTKPS